jgi:hypothetical protein
MGPSTGSGASASTEAADGMGTGLDGGLYKKKVYNHKTGSDTGDSETEESPKCKTTL